MKTTVDLPDDLVIAAKKRAAETRGTLKELVERGLRRELAQPEVSAGHRAAIRWVTVPGGLPPDLEVRSRAAMHDWLLRNQ